MTRGAYSMINRATLYTIEHAQTDACPEHNTLHGKLPLEGKQKHNRETARSFFGSKPMVLR